MIKVKNGEASLKGNHIDLGSDLAIAVKALVEASQKIGMSREEAIEFVRKSVELGLKTEEELREEAKRLVTKMMSDILSIMNESNEEGEESNE